jgi:hypothetical protein
MSNEAKRRGMDQTEQYTETLKYVKMQVLSNQLQRKLQEDAADISDADIEKYYKGNPDAFEQYNLYRIFVPRTKQVEAEASEDDDKDASQARSRRREGRQTATPRTREAMTKLADSHEARRGGGDSEAAEGSVRRRWDEDQSYSEPAERAPQRSASASCRCSLISAG